MSVVAQVAINFVLIECFKCGVPFQVTSEFDSVSLRDKRSFFCPNGHSQVYIGKTEAQKLREQLQAEIERRQRAENMRQFAENSARVLRGHVTRAKRRAAHGVCACCGRTFANMAAHMKRKHPDYVKEAQA